MFYLALFSGYSPTPLGLSLLFAKLQVAPFADEYQIPTSTSHLLFEFSIHVYPLYWAACSTYMKVSNKQKQKSKNRKTASWGRSRAASRELPGHVGSYRLNPQHWKRYIKTKTKVQPSALKEIHKNKTNI